MIYTVLLACVDIQSKINSQFLFQYFDTVLLNILHLGLKNHNYIYGKNLNKNEAISGIKLCLRSSILCWVNNLSYSFIIWSGRLNIISYPVSV